MSFGITETLSLNADKKCLNFQTIEKWSRIHKTNLNLGV